MATTAAPDWVDIQTRTFTKWMTSKLQDTGLFSSEQLATLPGSMTNGVALIQLLETISGEPLGRYNRAPKLRVQSMENANLALNYIKSHKIPLTNIGAEDIVDGNLKLILGLLWVLILRFTISGINQEGVTSKEGLLLWCQRKTKGYRHVDITDFTSSWSNGLGFCALIHRYRPDLIEYSALSPSQPRDNLQLAFRVAAEELGIAPLLDVDDICGVAYPDERSVMTYVAQYFHALSELDKYMTAGRRVEAFAENLKSARAMSIDYEKRVSALIGGIESVIAQWSKSSFDGSYEDARRQASAFTQFKRDVKHEWVREKIILESLLGNVQTKLSLMSMKAYTPPDGQTLEDLERHWKMLISAEAERAKKVNGKIREIKEQLRKSFADKANDFSLMINTLSMQLTDLEGDLDEQLDTVNYLFEHMEPLSGEVNALRVLNDKCVEANTEENDYTVYTYDDLEHEFRLAFDAITKKKQFLENQIHAGERSNLTEEQLKEFDLCFRHFARGGDLLQKDDFYVALASLGLIYDEQDLDDILYNASHGGDAVSYEQWCNFLIDEMEDNSSPEQVLLAFRDVADGKAYVTASDYRESAISEANIRFLEREMKATMLQEGRDIGYDYIEWMRANLSDKYLNGSDDGV